MLQVRGSKGYKMSNDWNTLDRQAPIPYVRDKAKKAYEIPTVKFQFEREQTKTITKETQDDHVDS